MEEVSGTDGKVRRGSSVFDRNSFRQDPSDKVQTIMDSKDSFIAMLKSMAA